jgi:hypothetical protein
MLLKLGGLGRVHVRSPQPYSLRNKNSSSIRTLRYMRKRFDTSGRTGNLLSFVLRYRRTNAAFQP